SPRSTVRRPSFALFINKTMGSSSSLGVVGEPERRAHREVYHQRFHAIARGAEIPRQGVDRLVLLGRVLPGGRIVIEPLHEAAAKLRAVVDRERESPGVTAQDGGEVP